MLDVVEGGFEPQAIDIMSEALEQAWARVLIERPTLSTPIEEATVTRERLAKAVFEGTRHA
jgi:hypothetical protein